MRASFSEILEALGALPVRIDVGVDVAQETPPPQDWRPAERR